ncbi:hypothetical protein AYO22_03067 [Fonsecaea multimorphosa]|nr:hypothetical protein AYO22_03067 [Fonsecaea multimorphosa]
MVPVNPLSLITAILGVPGEIAGARNCIDLLLKDKQNAQTYPTILAVIDSDLEIADDNFRAWRCDWHFEETGENIPNKLAQRYWGSGCHVIEIRVQQIALQLQTLKVVLEGYRPSDSKTRNAIKTGPLQDVRRLLDQAVKSFESLETESWKLLCQNYKAMDGEKEQTRRAAQHESYLLALAEQRRRYEALLGDLGRRYRNPENGLPYKQDLALDLTPGFAMDQRPSRLGELSRGKRIVHFVHFRPLSTQARQMTNVAPEPTREATREYLRVPGSWPLDPDVQDVQDVQDDANIAETLPNRTAGNQLALSIRPLFLEVEIVTNSDRYPNANSSLQIVLEQLCFGRGRRKSSRLFRIIGQSGTPNVLRFSLYPGGESAAESTTTDIAPWENCMLSYAKVELAFKAAEMMLLFGPYGLMDGLCICKVREIHLLNRRKVFVFEVAPGSCSRSCQRLSQLGFVSLGVFLAELFLGNNGRALTALTTCHPAQIQNKLNQLKVELEKIEWMEPGSVEAVIEAMRPNSRGLDDKTYYSLIISR